MGNPRPKKAAQILPLEVEVAYNSALKEFGFKPAGETAMGGLEYVSPDGMRVVVDKQGWTLASPMGGELDFGSAPKDLTPSLVQMLGRPTQPLPEDYDPKYDKGDKERLHGLGVKAKLLKRAVGLSNEGQPDAVCPKCQQPIADGAMVIYPNGKETHAQCPAPSQQQQQPGQQAPGWQSRLNLPPGYKPKQQPAPAKQPGMISPNVGRPQASLIAKINNLDKKALFGEGKHHHFSFEVPVSAGGTVAFHLAKAGLEDFEVNNYDSEHTTEFSFKTEPEMHIAEEIIRAEYAREISSQGAWKAWAPKQEDPTAIKSEKEISQHLMSSEKTADDDIYRELEEEGRQDKELSEEISRRDAPQSYDQALQIALAALDELAKVGPSEDIKGCASMSAGDLRQFAQEAKEGRARKFSADEYDATLDQVVAGLEKLAKIAPEDIRALASVSVDDLRRSAQLHTVMAREAKFAGKFLDFPTFSKWIEKIKTTTPEMISKLKVDTVPGFGISNGALRLSYEGKTLGYLGFPLEEFQGVVEPIRRWMEKSPQHNPNFDPYEMEKF